MRRGLLSSFSTHQGGCSFSRYDSNCMCVQGCLCNQHTLCMFRRRYRSDVSEDQRVTYSSQRWQDARNRKWIYVSLSCACVTMSLTLCLVSLKELMPLLRYLLANGRVMLDEWEEDHANGKIYLLAWEFGRLQLLAYGCTCLTTASTIIKLRLQLLACGFNYFTTASTIIKLRLQLLLNCGFNYLTTASTIWLRLQLLLNYGFNCY